MKIRLATPDDASILATLVQDVQRLHANALPDLFKQPDDLTPFARDFRERLVAERDSRIYIAEVDDQPAGYIYALIERRPENPYAYAWQSVHIDQISVRPTYQGKGCGRALVQAVFDLARSEGITHISLDTWAFNTEAHKFFDRMGFDRFLYRMDSYLTKEMGQV